MRRIESVMLDGPAGKLEALLEAPETPPREVCLVCHPHPLYGGTMHNKVVHRVARALRRSGGVVLRFNFRGVGKSEGVHGHGAAEVEDARAALAWLRARYPSLPATLAGFSFGARVVLQLACGDGDLRRVIALGLPTRENIPECLAHCTAPKVFVQSTRDQFGPRDDLLRLFALVPEPKKLIWIDSGDHFFAGALESLEQAVFNLGMEAL